MFRKILSSCKSEYGFTGQDLLIAMFILVLFLGLMTGVYVNLSNTSYEIKYSTDATEITTNVLEYFSDFYYDELTVMEVGVDYLGSTDLEDGTIVEATVFANSDDNKYKVCCSECGEANVVGKYSYIVNNGSYSGFVFGTYDWGVC